MAKIPNVNGVAGSEEEAGIIIALYEVSVFVKSIFMDLIPSKVMAN